MTTSRPLLTGLPPARRSCLSVPASDPRKLAKASGLGADEVILDLEDSVVATAKPSARAAVVAALRDWTGARVSVRVNPPRSPWCHLELAALAGVQDRPWSIVVPKVETAGDLAFIDRSLDGMETASGRRAPLRVQALIETAAGLANVDEIAGSCERLEALILGYADLAVSLGRPPARARDLDLWLAAQHSVLLAARHHGLQAIDGPFLGTAADEAFRAAAARARDLGFDGKWAIHPTHVPVLDALFRPSDGEVERAHAVLDALQDGERGDGAGAVALDGEMLDEAVRRSALRVLARAEPGSPAR
ncbi:MAG: CoA ester lyase [Solirubrobacteraceae bacterium]